MNDKKTEALKLALECIEAWDRGGNASDYWRDRFDAITAIRAALAEQPAQQPVSVTDELVEAYCWAWAQSFVTNNPYHTVKMTTEDRKHIAAGLRAALADQPAQQQEPVAWLHTKIEGVAVPHRPADLDKHPDRWTALYPEPKPCPTCEALARTVMMDQTAHDKQRKPLTDEQIMEMYNEPRSDAEMIAFARAIEAKLNEKNGGGV